MKKNKKKEQNFTIQSNYIPDNIERFSKEFFFNLNSLDDIEHTPSRLLEAPKISVNYLQALSL
jgi:hypothetical protein